MVKLLDKFAKLKAFVRSVAREFKNLKVPTKLETMFYLIVVLIMALISSIIFFVIDYFSFKIIDKITAFFT